MMHWSDMKFSHITKINKRHIRYRENTWYALFLHFLLRMTLQNSQWATYCNQAL